MSTVRALRQFFVSASLAAAVLLGAASSLVGTCGPFTDVAADSFCPFVLEIFYLGITTGTTPTTYDPTANVSRLQMAAFLSRTVDGVLKRGSRRAALDQFWTSQNATVLGLTTLSANPRFVASDGVDLWVTSGNSAIVSRVRASDGRLLETWTGAASATGVVAAMGRVVVDGASIPGRLYTIDPAQPAGSVTTVASNLGSQPNGITFDGTRIWTASGSSISIATPGAIPWTVTTVTTGFGAAIGAIFDGNNVWMTDAVPSASRPSPTVPEGFSTPGTLVKLSASGAILQSITVGNAPLFPAFDGSNIWVPNTASNSVTVVRASNGAVLQTLTSASIAVPNSVTFNGERVLVTSGGSAVTVWKAADLTPLGSFPIGANTYGACSDGINFWITMPVANRLARF